MTELVRYLEVSTGKVLTVVSHPTANPVQFTREGDDTIHELPLTQFYLNGWHVGWHSATGVKKERT